jgi:hypothetical protein
MNFRRLLAFCVLFGTGLAGIAHAQQSAAENDGGTVSTTATRGETPLHIAARTGDVAALQSQLKLGADPNAKDRAGRTPLINAAEQGHLDAAKVLIQAGADLNVRTRLGTAMEIAERNGHSDVAAALREAGASTGGKSVGDTVCVRSWGGDGYCGTVEAVNKQNFTLRITQIVGCEHGCEAKAECSAKKPVGGFDGIAAGDLITTKSWCLTHTGVQ